MKRRVTGDSPVHLVFCVMLMTQEVAQDGSLNESSSLSYAFVLTAVDIFSVCTEIASLPPLSIGLGLK